MTKNIIITLLLIVIAELGLQPFDQWLNAKVAKLEKDKHDLHCAQTSRVLVSVSDGTTVWECE